MTVQFDPGRLIWDCFGGLEVPEPAWEGDRDYWEGFNKAFFAANGMDYDPARDSNVAVWIRSEDRASFSDMVAALAPRLAGAEDADLVLLAHWLPDLHMGTSVTNYAMHRLGLTEALGFAISDRGLSAPLFAFDYAARVLQQGRRRKVLLMVMDQRTMLYRDPAIEALAPANVAALMVLDGKAPDGMAYRGYARRVVAEKAGLAAALAEIRAELGLPETTTVIGPNAVAPDVAIDPSLVCAAPFIALARLETSPAAALLATWHQGSLCAIGFQREGIRDAA